ncbi:glycosyltransferase family 4 protein [Nocardioides zeae]|uniref:Glycosyltransferase family 4 protein n=1 Tax=Nocardioides imazamoxiresistens TaxID=3231893 RepID=A0ABU3PXL4_9ACTN|nr:glycosyltransferase family 4 protein [Nocardioides zeae]MDT9593562.1 glycosyltransferase family 4 protein [Nocardioides zeae]
MTQVINAVLSWEFERFHTQFLATRTGGSRAGEVLTLLRALVALTRVPRATSVVAVVHLSQGGSFVREGMAVLLCRARGMTVVAHLHGSSFDAFAARHPKLVGSILRRCHAIQALSESSAATAAGLAQEALVAVIPNAVPSRESDAKRKPLVVFGGAVVKRKGVDVLLEAWSRLPADHGWRLAIAGPIPDREIVRGWSLPSVEYLGSLGHDDLMDLLGASSVAVLPSRDEAMPMFLLEAMSLGNAIVATRVGGVASLFSPKTVNYLIEPGDASALSQKLEQLLTNEAELMAMQRACSEFFQATYSAAVVNPKVEALWSDAMRGNPRSC